ncbi:MAG TPA: hypothetical protein VG204_20270 [Terriglobia bacterium]|nr:hypothetical protein [Terriglobia bacterium]
MNKLKVLLAALALCTFSSVVMAQSSGNFDAAATSAFCTLNSSTGALSPVCGIGDQPACPILDTTIKTSSGSGVTLVVTPSGVTGLLTDTKISGTVTSAAADVGIEVCLSIDGSANGILPNGNVVAQPDGTTAECVTYDQRFQQLSSSFFSTIAACVPAACTVSAAGDTCAAGTGPCIQTDPLCDPTTTTCGGVCSAPANTSCTLELLLSTLAAHSFNFVAQVPNGQHKVHASWQVFGVNQTNGSSSVAACFGPGTLTVTQTKIFKNSESTLTF